MTFNTQPTLENDLLILQPLQPDHFDRLFAVIDKKSGAAIGSTRFFPVKGIPNAVEMGWTFLARAYWGTDYNPSMKKLMLDYAFRFVDNVLFMIHETNYRSQKAVEKIGGKRVTELGQTPIETRSAANVVYVIQKSQLA